MGSRCALERAVSTCELCDLLRNPNFFSLQPKNTRMIFPRPPTETPATNWFYTAVVRKQFFDETAHYKCRSLSIAPPLETCRAFQSYIFGSIRTSKLVSPAWEIATINLVLLLQYGP